MVALEDLMAHADLRSRPGDIVTAIQRADRTGIVAASAPPATEEPKPVESTPSVLVTDSQPQRPAARRRHLVFTCAAALFLVVGWIGGGTFGHHEPEQAPALAVGAVSDQGQGGTKPAPPPVTTPQPVTPAAPTSTAPTERKKQVVPSTKRTTRTTEKTTAASSTGAGRADTAGGGSASNQSPMGTMAEELEQILGPWQAPWDAGQVYRSNRDFGLVGR
ncbi:hypothetical protein FNH07_19235 [Amycolatopsis bartoniae]|uniref:Uncharacterized protein n=2 Tax=Amycolatopsis bartoniae TaxID=941986 RepID=A0A8H9IVZ3_9PSEU|nr:hypothetical protein [Amycolatopsis bartoniae]TVT06595.1 hypothetical protein FNH07_19235 [Amycolatopsis bartoniae]GHF59484.1 hypothetical protein GCM10017566_36310 [Amycolatopsis bartoniae]